MNSCNGAQTCGLGPVNSLGSVGDNSCNGGSACLGKVGTVGDDSCDGGSACLFSTATIGDRSCTGDSVCYNVSGPIGNDSCNDYSACNNSTSKIGNNSCNGQDSCVLVSAGVGDNSCNGFEACNRLSTAVGDCANNLPGSVPAACGGTQPDAQIRRGSRVTYVGDNIYFPAFQGVGNNGVVGQKLVFFILIENDGEGADQFKVKRSGVFNNGFRVRYFDAANNDVTGQVNTGTFTTPTLASGADYVMRAAVRIRPQATACSSPVQRTMTITSVNDSSAKDAVRFAAGLIVC